MTTLRLGLCQWGVGRPDNVAGFAARLDMRISKAVGNADLLVLPEYACMEVASAFTKAADPKEELEGAVERADELLQVMRDAARKHKVWLLPGTLPIRQKGNGGRIRNRAPLIDPEGKISFQDKHVMTRFESESWGVQAGDPPAVFETPWGKIGIAICYDLEFPSLVRAQVVSGAKLILAPSCTDTMRGFNRVLYSARARALENQCYVAICPTVGEAPWSATLDSNHGYAAVAAPMDRGFPEDGLVTFGALNSPSWVFATLDFTRIDKVRQEGAVRNHLDWPPLPPPCPTGLFMV